MNLNAGKFKHILNVDLSSESTLKNAIKEVIYSYNDDQVNNQILIQPMVLDTKISGVIFAHTISRGAPYYVINFDDETEIQNQ